MIALITVSLRGGMANCLVDARTMASLYIRLDLPLPTVECESRDLPDGIARLIVARRDATDDRDSTIADLAHCIETWKPTGQCIYLVPLVLYSTVKHLRNFARTSGMPLIECGSEFALKCQTYEQIRLGLSGISCEELAILYSSSESVIEAMLRQLVDPTVNYSSHNAAFLIGPVQNDPALFFADTHVSLEVLGSPSVLLATCLKSLLPDVTESKETGAHT